VRDIVVEIVHRLVNKVGPMPPAPSLELMSVLPFLVDQLPDIVWNRQTNFDRSGPNGFFFQIRPVQQFPLLAVSSTETALQVHVAKSIESRSEWLEQKPAAISWPFARICHGIASVALTPSMEPNSVSAKEPSVSCGGIWIHRFISSGFTYPYLSQKKGRRRQREYSITIVLDAVQRLFTPFNASHFIATTAALLGAFPLISDYNSDEIVIDVIAVCDTRASLLVHRLPVRHLSDPDLIDSIIRTASHLAGPESGIGLGIQAALQLAAGRKAQRIIALTDGIVTVPGEILALKSALTECDGNGIDVLGIGVGIAPFHLHELFPVSLYCADPLELSHGLAAALDVSERAVSRPIADFDVFQ
jgi:hypothetical protein